MDSVLKEITQFADKCHGDQMRKYLPDRYIVHPVRVMELCKSYTMDISVLSAALLHDVLEDTPVTIQEIREFLQTRMSESEANKTLELVIELTDIYTREKYPQWNRRTRKDKETERLSKTSADAQTVKYADIIDNAPEIAEKDRDFAKRFLPECRSLLQKIPRGHPELYQRCLQTIDECMAKVKINTDRRHNRSLKN